MVRSKKIRFRMILFMLSVIIICFLSILVFLLIISPGKLQPITDQNGHLVESSICEKTFVKIGGVQQGMFIRGTDINNPVLLFVSGGPSFSEYFLVEKYPTGLEKYFTVCYWEERGGGISYTRQVSIESMNLQQLASDAIEVTNYLRSRFDKEKIFIMAHSGGTAFAIKAVESFPQLFHAYIGIAQITCQKESERMCYKYMLNQYLVNGNSKMVDELNKYPILHNDSILVRYFNSVLRDKAQHDLGIGTMHNMKSIIKGVFFPVWMCRAYTLKEKYNIWYSKISFVNKSGLREQIINSDIPAKVPGIDIPAYFFSGKYDLTVNNDLAKEYLKRLNSPIKGFYTFEKSAHSPMFEEPCKLTDIIINDVLNYTTILADD